VKHLSDVDERFAAATIEVIVLKARMAHFYPPGYMTAINQAVDEAV
jgi:hypothetical protein